MKNLKFVITFVCLQSQIVFAQQIASAEEALNRQCATAAGNMTTAMQECWNERGTMKCVGQIWNREKTKSIAQLCFSQLHSACKQFCFAKHSQTYSATMGYSSWGACVGTDDGKKYYFASGHCAE